MGALRVRHEAASAAFVRRQIEADLSAHDVSPETVDTVLLVASELVGNAVRHSTPSGDGTIDVQWDLDGDFVTVRVCDATSELPRRREPQPHEPDGRGLSIVEAVTDSWGAEVIRGGKHVWARIAVQYQGARRRQMA